MVNLAGGKKVAISPVPRVMRLYAKNERTDAFKLYRKDVGDPLYDMRGRCCWRRAYGSAKTGNASLSIPLSALGSTEGMYLLRVGRCGVNGWAAKSCYIRR